MQLKMTFPSWRDQFWIFCVIAGPVFWLFYGSVANRVPLGLDANTLLTVVLVILVYPILEEIVFRGWIQSELLRKHFFQAKLFQLSVANVLTSVLFSLFHLINHEPLWAALVFFPSILFGCLRDRYGAITPSIVLHVYYNFGFTLLSLV